MTDDCAKKVGRNILIKICVVKTERFSQMNSGRECIKINNTEGNLICIWKHEKKMISKEKKRQTQTKDEKKNVPSNVVIVVVVVGCCSMMDSTSAGFSCYVNINMAESNWIYEAKIIPQGTCGNKRNV